MVNNWGSVHGTTTWIVVKLLIYIYIFIRHLGSSTTADRQTYKHTHSNDN